MDERQQPTPGEIMIMAAGALMFIASFLHFSGNRSAWGSGPFPIVTLIPIYGIVMALQISLTRFAKVKLPDNVAGFTWEQLHLLLGVFAGLMALCWAIAADDRKIGLWLLFIGGIVAAVGAFMLQNERHTGALG